MASQFPPLIVMGVSGSGKSTIGAALGRQLNMRFIDADDLHPLENKVKMASGHALNDDDRKPWLEIIAARIGAELAEGNPIIVACSSLTRSYRRILISHAPSTVFVHLRGSREVIAERQSLRDHEFMPTSLLDSQFTTLEPLSSDERGVSVEIAGTPAATVQVVRQALADNFAG